VGVAALLDSLDRAGASDAVATLASRAAAHASLDSALGIDSLLDSLRRAGPNYAAALAQPRRRQRQPRQPRGRYQPAGGAARGRGQRRRRRSNRPCRKRRDIQHIPRPARQDILAGARTQWDAFAALGLARAAAETFRI
jgi:hypothetical protein